MYVPLVTKGLIHLASYPEELEYSNLGRMNYETTKQRDLRYNQQHKCRSLNTHYWNKVKPKLRPN
jgi:hypothetical protein